MRSSARRAVCCPSVLFDPARYARKTLSWIITTAASTRPSIANAARSSARVKPRWSRQSLIPSRSPGDERREREAVLGAVLAGAGHRQEKDRDRDLAQRIDRHRTDPDAATGDD